MLYTPPAGAIVTEVKVKPVAPCEPVAKVEAVKPKPVVAKKPKKQAEQRWF